MSLERIRSELADVDRQILSLVARRQKLVRAVGEAKDAGDRPLRDFAQEREVLERARVAAATEGVSPEVAESLMKLLVRYALTLQEQQRVATRARGDGKQALVIGGSGRMGGWFVRFLASQDYDVEIADPAESPDDHPRIEDWHASPLDHDLIVVATDLRTTQQVLAELGDRKPTGVVLDLGSLKSPLRESLGQLTAAGVKVTSIHPMFGPDTDMLSGKHVILVDQGCDEANRVVRSLFDSTMAEVVEMDLERHDRIVSVVLGLSHALNIAFFAALAECGHPLEDLARLSSTTFSHQLQVAERVAGENPHLYFEIQRMNDYGLQSLAGLRRVVERLYDSVDRDDEKAFVGMMQTGEAYLADRVD